MMITVQNPSNFKGEIPAEPGVYLFKDHENQIIYIGKAKSLHSRVRSYFSSQPLQLKTQHLVNKIRSIDWIVVDSEVEALLLENRLIKQHIPKYNISLKDAKTFAYIVMTKDQYPRVFSARKLSPRIEAFGPYTDGFRRRDLQELVVKVFKLRTCRQMPKKACLNYYIGLCTAPCIGNVSKEQYAKQAQSARDFLKGKVESTIEKLSEEMKHAAKAQQFERALELRNQIASIQLLEQRQKVDTIKDFDQDVLAFKRKGEQMIVLQLSMRRGVLSGKKEFSLDYQDHIEEEFLKAFYACRDIPREVLLNKKCWTEQSEHHALEEYLGTLRKNPVSIVVPKRGEKRALVKLAEKNIETNLQENSAVADLQLALNLPSHPNVIECFDISHLGQEHIVAGMVRFVNGKPQKKGYRRFRIRTTSTPDDFASMKEVVRRRYQRLSQEKTALPDLVVIDGGLGQINAAQNALRELGLQIPIISLAKKQEEIYLPGNENPKSFDKNSKMMLLLRQIRDEAHRFAITYNKKRRQMKMREEFGEK